MRLTAAGEAPAVERRRAADLRAVPGAPPDPHGQTAQRRIERDLLLFNAYRFLSTSYLFAPVFLLFFASRGLSVTQVTLLNTVYCGTLILFEVPTGVLADRWGRRRAMVLGSLLMATGALVDWAGHSFAAFAVGDGLLALGMTLTSGADSAYLYDLLRDARREHEYRRREGAASAAKLVGAAAALMLGGWLARSSLSATYLATTGVCLVASVVAAMLSDRTPRIVWDPAQRAAGIGPPPVAVAAQIVSSVRAVWTHRPLRFAVLFSTLLITLVRMSMYLHQPYLTRAGFDIGAVGVVLGVLALVGAVGAHRIEVLRRTLGEPALVWGMPAALAVSYLVLGRWFAGWGIALLVVQSLLNGVYSPLSKELLNREILDSSQRATVLSVESMARRIAFGLLAPAVGFLVDRYGLAAGLYGCAALGLAGTLVLAWRMARRRKLRELSFDGERTPTPLPLLEGAPVAVAEPIRRDA